MKNSLLLLLCFLSINIFAQDNDSIWRGDFEKVHTNIKDLRRVKEEGVVEFKSLIDSLAVKEFYLKIDSIIPTYILSFPNLKHLHIQSVCKIHNMTVLSELKQLEELNTHGCKFDTIPYGLANLKKCSVNKWWPGMAYEIKDYAGLIDMKKLEVLVLKSCLLKAIPNELIYLENLKELDLSGRNQIKDYRVLKQLQVIEIFTIELNYTRNHLPKELKY